MKYLTEGEFDRAYLVKKTVARTWLKRAAEIDSIEKAIKLATGAAKILSQLPDKKRCKTECCSNCNGLSCSRETHATRHMGVEFMFPGVMYCTTCKMGWEPWERFQVHDWQL